MGKLDTERLIKRFRTVLQDNLDAKLAAITAEYATEDASEFGDSITLETIAASSYFFNTSPLSLNIGVFIIIGVQAIGSTTSGPSVAKAYEIFVTIAHTGLKNDPTHNQTESKILRYTRAIQEVILDNFDRIAAGFSLAGVSELPANPEIQLESGETLRVSGLVFSATIA